MDCLAHHENKKPTCPAELTAKQKTKSRNNDRDAFGIFRGAVIEHLLTGREQIYKALCSVKERASQLNHHANGRNRWTPASTCIHELINLQLTADKKDRKTLCTWTLLTKTRTKKNNKQNRGLVPVEAILTMRKDRISAPRLVLHGGGGCGDRRALLAASREQ
eukprot:INCI8277.10.p1 GENE.INCI8277.10~~INCI8277.10.p1  ORF type:complete len:163 (-),score=19.54 INCI8277.10:109-597(-)